MARWRKVDTRIWADERFRAFSDKGKLLFLYILTHPSMTVLGAMRHTVAGLASELGWTDEATRDAMGDAIGTSDNLGPLVVNEGAHLFALRNWFKYNRPEYPRGLEKLWGGALDLIPECSEKYEIIGRSIECLDLCTPKMKQAMGGGIRRAMVDAMRGATREPTPDGIGVIEREREQERDDLSLSFAFANDKGGDPINDDQQQPEAAPKKRKKNGSNGKHQDDSPLPFAINAAMKALRDRCPRVVPPADFGSRHGKIVSSLIRSFPEMSVWERVGDWLAAGGAVYMSLIGVDALNKHFGTFVTASDDWEKNGRQPVGKGRASGSRGMRWGAA